MNIYQIVADNAGWVIALGVFIITRQQDRLREQQNRVMAVSDLSARLQTVADKVAITSDMIVASNEATHTRAIDFWQSKWPVVERALQRMEDLDRRVVTLELWRASRPNEPPVV